MSDETPLRAEAYARYQEAYRGSETGYSLLGYDIAERAKATPGTLPWEWAVPYEIIETINVANAWSVRLYEWGVWNTVLETYNAEDDKWNISAHFIEPLAFFCMQQPCSMADRLVVVAENALHQANLRVIEGYRDCLATDKEKEQGKIQPRSKKRLKQLSELGKHWTAYKAFRHAIGALDKDAYRKATRNFRNLSAHSIAPRFFLGHIRRATRSVNLRHEIAQRLDGATHEVDYPSEKVVAYSMIEHPPLALTNARDANLQEFLKAKGALEKFFVLVDEMCSRLVAVGTGAKENLRIASAE